MRSERIPAIEQTSQRRHHVLHKAQLLGAESRLLRTETAAAIARSKQIVKQVREDTAKRAAARQAASPPLRTPPLRKHFWMTVRSRDSAG